jgi:predicted CopG family antitoxin
MAVKTITITEDAYSRLAALKEPGESFSEVLIRFTGSKSLLDLVGVLSPVEAKELERVVRDARKRMRARLAGTAREFA